ncbi:MAG TPA: MG2 domain-containing protein, partial [Thermoanaerobaculia bacterium]|nr:MG2 domain-containing protein [Thermoanaerobaculia bacterium]
VKQWLSPLSLEQLMPSIAALEKNNFTKAPPTPAQDRKLAPAPDKIQSYGLDVSSAAPGGKGLMWVALQEGETLPRTERYNTEEVQTRATVVQVTNLGISVKDSPLNTLIFVTRLDNAAPVAGASVAIRDLENKIVWSGTTDDKGLAIAPSTPDLRAASKTTPRASTDDDDEYENFWEALSNIRFIVTAEKDSDAAYVASNWTEGISPYEFDENFDLSEKHPLLRGTVFTDRGVYKPGEEVHLKAVLRTDTPNGMQLLNAATSVTIVVKDTHDKEVDRRTVTLNEWSSSDWTWKVPADAVLGDYRIMARVEGQRLRVYGDFLVAAYRRPDFRVDVKLTAPSSIAGTKIDGRISGRYLFGGAMSSRPVKWTYSKSPLYDVPRAITEHFSESQYTFLGYDSESTREQVVISSKEQKLDAKGDLALKLETDVAAGWPWSYSLEGDVTDVSRQKIAGRNSVRIDPAPWYIGIKTPPYFSDAATGLDTAFVAAGLDGNAVAGVTVNVELHRIQWNSVRQAEGNGFYTWDTQRKEVPAGSWSVTTTAQPAPLHIPLNEGGEYVVIATAKDGERSTTSRAWFYASGGGYTAWARYDHNRIDLVPERKTYKPGESARIMVKSPWERATALVTTEREGVRTWRQFELTSTQQTISVPISEKDIPNVFVSVLLLKGRTKEPGGNDEGDPGKPTFRLGYVELDVEDATKRLSVDVKANQVEYRPATKAKIEVNVRDAKGAGARSEVTLWAVDYGVLSLTGYKTPDVLDSIYLRKALQVVTEDSRQKVISRRVLTPKGVTDGGGGGRDAGPGVLRKDFRVLAFWLGSLVTDKNGRARTEITLPESLTTYRIMAVAGDKASRFGWAQNEIRINKPLLLTPAFPRFLALGDKALFGSVVHSQLKTGGKATVTVQSMDPSIVAIDGEATQRVDVAPGGAIEVRFNAIAKAVGNARIRMSVAMNGESDAFEDVLPVRLLLPADTVAAYGDTNAQAREMLSVPNDVIPSVGGLRVELASTQMVNLAEGAQYLVEYPYGCAEQRSSSALALMLVSDLGEAFKLPNLNAAAARATAQQTIAELYKFQCGSGGFSFWAGECDGTSPYLTAWVLHVLQRAQSLKYGVSKDVLDRAYHYLDTSITTEKRPTNEGYWPSYLAWQAFAVKVLAEGKVVNQDSNVNRLIPLIDRMPLFGIAHLADAVRANSGNDSRYADLRRRLTNAIAPEAGEAHVEELNDPYLLWLWSSNARTTAIVLGALVRGGEDEQLVKQIVRWLMRARKGGRWGNTQENAWAMESLVDYYTKYESEVPDFTGVVTIGSNTIARDPFKGRSATAQVHEIPIAQLPRGEAPVVFDRQGAAGTLFYLMRLRYSAASLMNEPRDQGFRVERRY